MDVDGKKIQTVVGGSREVSAHFLLIYQVTILIGHT